MLERNNKVIKPVLSALKGNRNTRVPLWYMRQAGRYLPEYRELRKEAGDFLTLCYSPELAIRASLQPLKRFDLDAAILFSDILVVPHALGRKVRYIEGEGPVLDALLDVSSLPNYDKEKFLFKLEPMFETIEGIVSNVSSTTTVIGFAGAPWTIATYMVEGRSSRDFSKTRAWAINDPTQFKILIDLLVDITADYLIAQLNAGADTLQIFDSWAGVLSETELVKWSLDTIMSILDRVRQAYPDVPVIVFPRGVGVAYLDYARKDEIACVSLDQSVPLKWVKEILQPRSVVQGNLDPMLLVEGKEKMFEEAERILSTLSEGSLIFNLGHGILPNTPTKNVAALTKFVHDWRL